MRDHFQTTVQQWTAKKASRKLESILSNSAAKHNIDKVIAIACGSMASDDLPGDGDHSYDQHAQVLTVQKWAAKQPSHSVSCYAQDPVYTEIDKSILNENGTQVTKDPQAWLEVDDSSVVLSFYPNIPVRDILADLARPAVLICNRLETDEEVDWEVDEDSEDERYAVVLNLMVHFTNSNCLTGHVPNHQGFWQCSRNTRPSNFGIRGQICRRGKLLPTSGSKENGPLIPS